MNAAISNSDNVINTKELMARIHWLEQALNYRCSDEYSDELKMLRALAEHIESVASPTAYDEGSDLVRDSYLQQYMSSAESTNPGSVSRLAFSPVNFGGTIYWLRGAS